MTDQESSKPLRRHFPPLGHPAESLSTLATTSNKTAKSLFISLLRRLDGGDRAYAAEEHARRARDAHTCFRE